MRRIVMLVVVALVMAAMMLAMAMPAFAAKNHCGEASSSHPRILDARNNGQAKQLDADVFTGGSVGELQQSNCNPKQFEG
jgi:hypothetical protein